MPEQVLLVMAEDGGRPVAGALNLIGSHALFGRNWGCLHGQEIKHLHFELCYYQACSLSHMPRDTLSMCACWSVSDFTCDADGGALFVRCTASGPAYACRLFGRRWLWLPMRWGCRM